MKKLVLTSAVSLLASVAIATGTTHSSPLFSATDNLTGSFTNTKLGAFLEMCGQDCAAMVDEGKIADTGFVKDMRTFFRKDSTPITNVFELERLNLNQGRAKKDVWEASYWPLKNKGIANRYAGRVSSGRAFPPRPAGASDVSKLAPSEKYDFLIGDQDYTLSKFEWNRYNKHNSDGGRIRAWEGYCHGWAMAATREQRPAKTVTVTAANGQKVSFRPSDLKALSSSMWANYLTKLKDQSDILRWSGLRCYSDRPARSNGRILQQRCFDVNPGTWHTIVSNVVGKDGDSLIFDASYNAQVWNYPVLAYSYKYFNPNNRRARGNTSLKSSIIRLSDLKRDKFAKYRSPKAKYIVGVQFDLQFRGVQRPSKSNVDEKFSGKIKKTSYKYDLELDENYNIVGGEWHQKKHPDLLWRPNPAITAKIDADVNAAMIDVSRGVYPASWRTEAKQDSKNGIPSGTVIRELLQMAQ